jgi:hypothetical protein
VQEAAQKNGAIAVLIIQSNFPRKASSPKGFQYLNAFKKVVLPNTFYISEQVARDIWDQILHKPKEKQFL